MKCYRCHNIIYKAACIGIALVAAGAMYAQACHPSYEDECVAITSDADCASGSGNGPAYVRGPVRVVGPDEYGLDRDHDGWGCEN